MRIKIDRKRLGKLWWLLALALSMALLFALLPASVRACGGLFCQGSAVDQNAERIIFTQNNDGTVSAIIQIQYTGFSSDFSWVLPIPTPITADDIEVPEDAMAAFTELEIATNPIFIPPPFPDCAPVAVAVAEGGGARADDGDVEVFASGEVGPYAFDVIGSDDPTALIIWLRDHDYRVTEPMEPLINVYVEEGMVFLAMQLLPEQGAQDIQPVKVTYETDNPMIPLRLTAVAANPDMAVLTWFYADHQTVPVNYAHMEIPDEDITFFTFGGNDYRQLIGEYADRFNGQAFVTEYAAPTSNLPVSNPLLQELARDYRYVTRLNTVISPEEMTLDPVFETNSALADVSNVHDLSNMTGLYDCEREASGSSVIESLLGIDPVDAGSDGSAAAPGSIGAIATVGIVLVCGSLAAGLVGAGVWLGRRSRKEEE